MDTREWNKSNETVPELLKHEDEATFSQWCEDGYRHDWRCEDVEVWGLSATDFCPKCGLTVQAMTGKVLATNHPPAIE